MKKFYLSVSCVIISIMMLVALAGCSKQEIKSEVTVKEIYQKISSSVKMPEELVELTEDDLLDYYGIEADMVSDFVAVQDACGYKDEVVIIKATDEKAAGQIESLLNDHIAYQKESMRDYDAEQYQVLGSSAVIVKGNYVAMFISPNQSNMIDIYASFFK